MLLCDGRNRDLDLAQVFPTNSLPCTSCHKSVNLRLIQVRQRICYEELWQEFVRKTNNGTVNGSDAFPKSIRDDTGSSDRVRKP